MRKLQRQAVCLGLSVLFALLIVPPNAFSDVTLFAECAYTETDCDCYIYAGIDPGTELRSASFKLTYDAAELTLDQAERDSSVWYLGDAAPGFDTPNAIDTSTAGQVIVTVGKLDTTDTSSGVGGSRATIGVVKFNRTESSMPFSPTLLTLTLGRSSPFDNVVQTDGVVLDATGVTIGSPAVMERGDANGDGFLTNLDMFTVRGMLSTGDYVVYADCNDDGYLTNLDMFCIRGKL